MFARALDKNVKKSTIRGASGEVDVENFLKDFETSLDRLEERFDAKYAASAELNAVMRQAGGIEKFIQSQSPALKGRSEWDDFKASLQSLAAAYGSVFPLDESKPPRRMNDLEIQQAADSVIDHGSKLRKKLSDVFSKEEKQAKETAQADIDAMQKAAKNLKARVDDGKPASGEAAVLADSVKKLRASLGTRTLPGDAKKGERRDLGGSGQGRAGVWYSGNQSTRECFGKLIDAKGARFLVRDRVWREASCRDTWRPSPVTPIG